MWTKCPECRGPVRFSKDDIVCPHCGWHPPTAVKDAYAMTGFNNTRIVLVSAFLSLLGLGYYLVLGQSVALAIIVVGLVTVPIILVLRDRWISGMVMDSK